MLLKTEKFLLARLFFLVTFSFQNMELPITIINISSIILYERNLHVFRIFFIDKQTNLNFFFLFFFSGSVIVHVITPQMRNFYKLEKRWKEAEVRNILYSLLPHINT